MDRSGGGKARRSRTRISNGDVEFYEENIARMLSIINEVRGISLDVTDPALLESIIGRLARITEQAGRTRRSLIAQRDEQQGAGSGDEDC